MQASNTGAGEQVLDVFVATQDENVRRYHHLLPAHPTTTSPGRQPSLSNTCTESMLFYQGFGCHATALASVGSILIAGGSNGAVGLLPTNTHGANARLRTLGQHHSCAVTAVIARCMKLCVVHTKAAAGEVDALAASEGCQEASTMPSAVPPTLDVDSCTSTTASVRSVDALLGGEAPASGAEEGCGAQYFGGEDVKERAQQAAKSNVGRSEGEELLEIFSLGQDGSLLLWRGLPPCHELQRDLLQDSVWPT
jgi:hypothetical protein